MPARLHWTWHEPKRMRKLLTVEDHLLWSYSVLSVSREVMQRMQGGEASPLPEGRTKAANILMSRYQDGRKNITNLDRDDALAQNGIRVCAHFGCIAPHYHMDHLIPKSRLSGDYIPLNQVRSCPHCNTSRGNSDLMGWHRSNATFPSLAILRRYLKLCYFYAQRNNCLQEPVEEAVANGLPFEPRNLPRLFPPVQALIWDYAYPA